MGKALKLLVILILIHLLINEKYYLIVLEIRLQWIPQDPFL